MAGAGQAHLTSSFASDVPVLDDMVSDASYALPMEVFLMEAMLEALTKHPY